MELKDKRIGFAVTASCCNFGETKTVLEELKEKGVKEILPIVSFSSKNINSRFYKGKEYVEMIEKTANNKVIDTIEKAEPVGPKDMVDIILVCPCTGNTLAKLANGITDTPVLMAIKGHIRNNKPVVIGVSTNDGLGMSLKNIGIMLNTKSFYFVPFRQDDCKAKPKSLVLDYNYIIPTLEKAFEGKQIQPLLSKY